MMSTKETKKRCLMEMAMGEEGEEVENLDLNLSLALPRMNSKVELSNPLKASSTLSQETCISYCSNPNKDIEGSSNVVLQDEVPSLVLMGCSHCYLYVMVSELAPKCPKCKSSVLIDIFRKNHPAKRFKKS